LCGLSGAPGGIRTPDP